MFSTMVFLAWKCVSSVDERSLRKKSHTIELHFLQRERLAVGFLRRCLGSFDGFHEEIGAKGLGPFDGEAEGAGPDQGREDAQGAGDSEEDGVVVHLLHAEVLEEDSGVGVHVGPGVLDLACFEEHRGHDLVHLRHQLWQENGKLMGYILFNHFFQKDQQACQL